MSERARHGGVREGERERTSARQRLEQAEASMQQLRGELQRVERHTQQLTHEQEATRRRADDDAQTIALLRATRSEALVAVLREHLRKTLKL